MPYGECRSLMKTSRTSATPSPFASRSSVMRFALGVTEPARFMNSFWKKPRTPLPSSGLGGALVSATRTSPLGSA